RADDLGGPLEPRDLADRRADRAGGPGDEHRVPRPEAADVHEPHVRREPGGPQHAEEGRDRHAVDLLDHPELPAVALGHVAPAQVVQYHRPDRVGLGPGLDDPPDGAAGHGLVQLERRDVGAALVHPSPHVRIHRDELVGHPDLALGQVVELDLHRAEVLVRGPALGAGRELDLLTRRHPSCVPALAAGRPTIIPLVGFALVQDQPLPDTSAVALPDERVRDEIVNDSHTFRRAVADLRQGLQQRELWLSLGWQDIKQRYRRSTLGPLWITIATGVMAGALGLLYSVLFQLSLADFLPHVTVGLIMWGFISGCIKEGSEV